MIRAALAWLVLLTSTALAQDWPALYDVTGVSAGDVLNVREAPDVRSPIVGKLPPHAGGIEVVEASDDGRWGLINIGQRSGWASLRYLAPADTKRRSAFLPVRNCFGTEPFWSLALGDGPEVAWAEPGTEDAKGLVSGWFKSQNRYDRQAARLSFFDGREGTAIFSAMQCGDGMSDRSFGIAVELFLQGDGASRLLSGCCSIRP